MRGDSAVPTTSAGHPSEKLGSLLSLLVAVLLIPAVLGSSKTIFNDGDVSWHIATGQWIIDHHRIPNSDPFSFTWLGKPWVPIEWLSEIMYATAYRLAGYGGVAALVTAALIALHALIFVNARRWLRFALLPIVAMDFIAIPMLTARPHVLTWPIIALWTLLMLRAREQDRAPPLLMALLMTLWANLHGGFVFGFLIAGAFALEALVSSANRPAALRQWLLFGCVCVAAIFVNGNGIEGVVHPLRFTQMQMLPLIDEWKPSSPTVTPFFFVIVAIVGGSIVWKRPKLSWVRWILLAGFLLLALLQVRHQAMAAIIAAMVLPEGFAKGQIQPVADSRAMLLVTAGAAALLVVARTLAPIQPAANEANPWHLIAMVPQSLRSQPVLNGYSMGGPLILSGIRPYIDGRGDMYGDALVIDYAHIVHGDRAAFAAAVQRWDLRWVILSRQSRLVVLLEHLPDWQLIRADKVGVIYVRR